MKPHKHLFISGLLFTLILFTWPILMGLFQTTGSIAEQLQWIGTHQGVYKLQFFMAFLISPSILYMMLVQLERSPAIPRLNFRLGLIFFTAYTILCSISYASQIILVPGFIQAGYLEQAQNWYFKAPVSVSYFCNQMGYFFWGMGALVWFAGLVKEKGTIRYLSLIYGVSAILSILAFAGLMMNSRALNSLTLYGGLVLIPTGILSMIWAYQEKKFRTIPNGR